MTYLLVAHFLSYCCNGLDVHFGDVPLQLISLICMALANFGSPMKLLHRSVFIFLQYFGVCFGDVP